VGECSVSRGDRSSQTGQKPWKVEQGSNDQDQGSPEIPVRFVDQEPIGRRSIQGSTVSPGGIGLAERNGDTLRIQLPTGFIKIAGPKVQELHRDFCRGKATLIRVDQGGDIVSVTSGE
jgi:hypothetical protein